MSYQSDTQKPRATKVKEHCSIVDEKLLAERVYYGIQTHVYVMKTDIDSDCYRYTDIYNDEEYRNLVQKILDGSLYPCEGRDVLEKEMNEETVEAFFHKYQFLTLSTCRTGEGRDARLLVIGCKKRE